MVDDSTLKKLFFLSLTFSGFLLLSVSTVRPERPLEEGALIAQEVFLNKNFADDKTLEQKDEITSDAGAAIVAGASTDKVAHDPADGYIVQFDDVPLATKSMELDSELVGQVRSGTLTTNELSSTKEKRLLAYRGILDTNQNTSIQKIKKIAPNTLIKGQFTTAFNGIHANLSAEEVKNLKAQGYKIWPNEKMQINLDASVPLINADDVWQLKDANNVGVKGNGIRIAIIDTGIDYRHRDIGTCLGMGCKVAGGYDFINNDSNPIDDHGHGTHVAATAAGNGVLKGVAPNATLYAYKVLDRNGSGTNAQVIAGINRALDPNQDGNFSDMAHVMNLSLGGSGDPNDPVSQAVDNAVDAGSVVVVAAGNSGPGFGTIGSPGKARKALTVGATARNDIIANFSSRGPVYFGYVLMKPDVTAPGVSICAAQWGTAFGENCRGDSYLVAISGTSMATPHVAGAVALVKQAHPTWTPLQIKSAFKSTAKSISNIPSNITAYGAGRIDVLRAVSLTTTPPVATLLSIGQLGDILGRVESSNLKSWKLEYNISDTQAWVEVKKSTTLPTALELFRFAAPMPDSAFLRLTVEEFDGDIATDHGYIYFTNPLPTPSVDLRVSRPEAGIFNFNDLIIIPSNAKVTLTWSSNISHGQCQMSYVEGVLPTSGSIEVQFTEDRQYTIGCTNLLNVLASDNTVILIARPEVVLYQTGFDEPTFRTPTLLYHSNVRSDSVSRSDTAYARSIPKAMSYFGEDISTATSYAYHKITQNLNIPLSFHTVLEYYIRPAGSANGKFAGIDLVMNNGTTMRDSNAVDQFGVSMHPSAQGVHPNYANGSYPSTDYHLVKSNIGRSNLLGLYKSIKDILVAYDQGPSLGYYQGVIDDLKIYDPALVPTIITPSSPVLSGASINSLNVTANAVASYEIAVVASDANGGADITSEYALINYQGPNAGQYRGYMMWSSQGFPHSNNSFKSPGKISCTGGGEGALYDGGNAYGSSHINLISCRTVVSGDVRTSYFTVTFNSTFTSPVNNSISGWASDAGSLIDGWESYGTFLLTGNSPTLAVSRRAGASVSLAPATTNQTLGVFNFTAEYDAIDIPRITFYARVKGPGEGVLGLINISLYNAMGVRVLGPYSVMATSSPSGGAITFTDLFSLPSGNGVYTLKGDLSASFLNGQTVQVYLNPSVDITGARGRVINSIVTPTPNVIVSGHQQSVVAPVSTLGTLTLLAMRSTLHSSGSIVPLAATLSFTGQGGLANLSNQTTNSASGLAIIGNAVLGNYMVGLVTNPSGYNNPHYCITSETATDNSLSGAGALTCNAGWQQYSNPFTLNILASPSSRILKWKFDAIPPVPTNSVSISSPASGATLYSGAQHRITWATVGTPSSYTIDYAAQAAPDESIIVATDIPGNQSYYDWPLSSSMNTGSYNLTVCAWINPQAVCDTKPFTVVQPTINITSPVLNSVIPFDSSATITWGSNGIGSSVKLDLMKKTSGSGYVLYKTIFTSTSNVNNPTKNNIPWVPSSTIAVNDLQNTFAISVTGQSLGGTNVIGLGRAFTVSGPTVPPPPSSQNLLARFAFEEGSGSMASDSSGNGNTATLRNGPSWVAGQTGNGALAFNGINQSGDIGYKASGFFKARLDHVDVSVAAWIKPNSLTAWQPIYQIGGCGNSMVIGLTNSGSVRFAVRKGGVQRFVDSPALTISQLGQWVHVTGVNSSSGTTVYINGMQVASAAGAFTWNAGYNYNSIGTSGNTESALQPASCSGSIEYFNGVIDELKIYDYALSSSDVSTIAGIISSPQH